MKKFSFGPGKPTPLGPTSNGSAVNFALYAPDHDKMAIGLFLTVNEKPDFIIDLDPDRHFTNGIWHIAIHSLPEESLYAFSILENWVVDPFAKSLTHSANPGKKQWLTLGGVCERASFDWEGVEKPGYPIGELIIYEMHVRGFTNDRSSVVEHPGSFSGVVEKIPHLLDLGINAVELMPIFSFDKTHHSRENLCNYWGYAPEHFFCPRAAYGSPTEFKEMVKALHRAGIEIILDVVYNHIDSPWYQALAKSSYFILDSTGNHTNYTGCGNTINTNHPHTMEWILSSQRYFAKEMQVDGFRFDLASIFCRNHDGSVLKNPAIIEAMCADPLLKGVKLIAEPWDCGGLYQVGTFPRSDRFAQWNGRYRDAIRRFLKGTDGAAGDFAKAVAGSPHFHSINFITSHDGFTLRDLVSYNEKHNEANGEGNRDGNCCNESWNCGVEGSTSDPEIASLRMRQMKNFILALAFSAGTPMMLMGDEYGHTRRGNNNAYCQDNELNYFLWDRLRDEAELYAFFKKCIHLRKGCKILLNRGALDESCVSWHEANWTAENRCISYSIQDEQGDYFLCFNADAQWASLQLPKGKSWKRLIDTALPDAEEVYLGQYYALAPHSSLLILA